MYRQKASSATLEQAHRLLAAISDLLTDVNITLDHPEAGHIRFRGRFLCDLDKCFDQFKGRFEQQGYTPAIREENGEISLIAMPMVFNPPASKWIINLILLVATLFATLLVGALSEIGSELDPGMSPAGIYSLAVRNLWLGLPYSLSLMLILGAHEFGHYLAARYHKVPVSLPYFIPFPIPPIGTMGAFIRLKAPMTSRRALFDVGAAGPLAGMLFAIPILVYGLATSPVQPFPAEGYYQEGNSIFYASAKAVLKGQILPTDTEDITLNQFAWAGWVGLLVTGLNLIPVGQLDGGHVAYALFGKRARRFYWPAIIGLALLAILTLTFMWGIWVLLIYLLGRYHAEPLNDVTPINGWRRSLAVFTLIVFVLVFVPIPLRLVVP